MSGFGRLGRLGSGWKTFCLNEIIGFNISMVPKPKSIVPQVTDHVGQRQWTSSGLNQAGVVFIVTVFHTNKIVFNAGDMVLLPLILKPGQFCSPQKEGGLVCKSTMTKGNRLRWPKQVAESDLLQLIVSVQQKIQFYFDIERSSQKEGNIL